MPFKGTSSGIVTTVGFDPVAGIVYTRLDGQGEAHPSWTLHGGRVHVSHRCGLRRSARNRHTHGSQRRHARAVDGGGGTLLNPWVRDVHRCRRHQPFRETSGSYEQVITFAVPPPAEVIPYTEVIGEQNHSLALKARWLTAPSVLLEIGSATARGRAIGLRRATSSATRVRAPVPRMLATNRAHVPCACRICADPGEPGECRTKPRHQVQG